MTKKCSCGFTAKKEELIKSYGVVNEMVATCSYNDLTPSNLIDYEEKRRFVYKYSCPKCQELLIIENGILF